MGRKISISLIVILTILISYLPNNIVRAAANNTKVNNYNLETNKDNRINNMIIKNKEILRNLKSNINPIHKYDFKINSGLRAEDMGTERIDGQIKGAQFINQNGNSFRRFDGIDDCIEFNSPVIPLGKKVIKFKIRVPEAPQYENYCIISNRSSGESSQSGICSFLYAKESEKRLYFQIWKDNNLQVSVNCNLPYDNNFHEVMFVLDTDASNNNVKLYVDDMNNPKNVATCIGVESSKLFNFAIGKDTYKKGNYNFFKGDLEYLEVYNSINTNSEEVNLMIHYKNLVDGDYIVTKEEAERFINWYEDRSNGIGSKTFSLKTRMSNNQIKTVYVNFDNVIGFEIP